MFHYHAVPDALDTSNGAGTKRAVLALEAAFANRGPVPGDQVVFTRIRVAAGMPEDGNYTLTDLAGNISNLGTVTVNVTPAVGGVIPTAVGDAFAVTVNTTTALDVLANDLANGGTLDPASVTVAGPQPPQVTGVNPDGTIQFVAGASPGIVAFQYSVRDVGGTVASTASVAVDVVAPEVITVTPARCRASRSRWRVTGTSTGPDGTLISLFLPGGALLGTAVVGPPNATGVWDFNPGAGSAACPTPISLQSSLGTTVTNIPVVQGLN